VRFVHSLHHLSWQCADCEEDDAHFLYVYIDREEASAPAVRTLCVGCATKAAQKMELLCAEPRNEDPL